MCDIPILLILIEALNQAIDQFIEEIVVNGKQEANISNIMKEVKWQKCLQHDTSQDEIIDLIAFSDHLSKKHIPTYANYAYKAN